MADKLMDIPNDDTQNYPYCRLKSVVEHSTKWTKLKRTKVSKVVRSTNKKTLW